MFDEKSASSYFWEIVYEKKFGESEDLLTAGLGRSGLTLPGPEASALAFADPASPTLAELRRNSIINAHIGLIDRSSAAGYGIKYGPGVIDEKVVDDGKVPGHEYLGFARTSHGGPSTIVTMLVQIPDNFDSANPVIVAAAPSASRTIYGAVPVVGEWALQHGCAVVYTDKGLGVGFHDLDRNMAFAIDGECVDAEAPDVNYKGKRPGASWQERYPYRFACKHAHSQRNPEQSWGQDVRRSIRFAFYVLNKHFKSQNNVTSFTRKNTKVIAAGISNGGAAALLAAEADLWDGQDLIDAVVAAEPTIQPSDSIPLTIIDGGEKVGACNRSLIDYLSLMNVYQVCTDLNSEIGKERIRTLKALGLLNNRSAQEILNDYGLLKAQNEFAHIYDAYQVPLCVSVTYANAYGRFDVAENLCDYSLAALNPSSGPGPIPREKLRQLYAIGNGIPPSGGVHVINNSRNLYAPISTPDGGAEGALSLRRVVTGGGEGAGSISREQKAREHAWHRRLDAGVREVRATGYLHNKWAIIVQGRNDALVAPNHCGRAYYARNQIVENVRSKLRYYEVTNAHHFDAWNSMTNFAPFKPCVPLHLYFIRAMSLIYAQLKRQHEPLPPSQVIYARKSGGDLEVPEISPNPAGYGEIKLASGVLTIPQEPPSLQAERALPAETVGLDLIRKATSHAIAVG